MYCRLACATVALALLPAAHTLAQESNRPNLQVRLSANLIQNLVGKQFDAVEPVDDTVLGRHVHGSGKASGTGRIALHPNREKAEISLEVHGTIHRETQIGDGTVVTYTAETIPFTARQRLTIDDQAVLVTPTEVSAQATSELRGVGILGVMGVWPMRKLPKFTAKQRYYREKEMLERAAGQRAEQSIHARMAQEDAWAPIRHLQAAIASSTRTGLQLNHLHFATNSEAMFVNVRVPTPNQPIYETAPPRLPHADDLALRVHQNAINEILYSKYTGASITASELGEQLSGMAAASTVTSQRDLVLRFASVAPIAMRFHANTVSLFLRLEEMQFEGLTFEPLDAAITYEFVPLPNGHAARRVGNVQVLPRDVEGGSSLTLRQELRGDVIRRRLERLFTEEFSLDVQFPNQPPLSATVAHADDGWLLINWVDARSFLHK